MITDWQCGDCEHNTGDSGEGCKCELTGKTIDICDPACKEFQVYSDIE